MRPAQQGDQGEVAEEGQLVLNPREVQNDKFCELVLNPREVQNDGFFELCTLTLGRFRIGSVNSLLNV